MNFEKLWMRVKKVKEIKRESESKKFRGRKKGSKKERFLVGNIFGRGKTGRRQ